MADQEIATEVGKLVSFWSPRDKALRAWYKMIQLEDTLKQDKMESVISTDPRTGFNMAKWLLQPKTSSFRVDTEGFTETQSRRVGAVEKYADRQLLLGIREKRVSLKGSFMRRLIGLMLATGWYSIMSYPISSNRWWMEVWNPAQVYPEYSSDGELIAVGRRYTISGKEAEWKVRVSGWKSSGLHFNDFQNLAVNNLWRRRPTGITHAVAIGTEEVKPETLTPFREFPILVGPCAGLPDDGGLLQDDSWKAEIGNSIVAPIMDIQQNYNKMLTYLQQLLRDTANPRWVERTMQGGVVTPENIYERGAIFTIEPGEDIYPLDPPPLPAEFRGHQFDLRNQVQRSLFSDITFGNITQQVSGFLMNQVTAASKQVLDPFYGAVRDITGEMGSRNIMHQRVWGMDMGRESFPALPEEVTLDFNYSIEIPGDFIQRASTARVLNPNFRLSPETLYDNLFPEVQNAMIEMGRLRTADALESEPFKLVFTIHELSQAAEEARANRDTDMAELLDRAAQLASDTGFGQANERPTTEPGVRPEALPGEVQEVLQGR